MKNLFFFVSTLVLLTVLIVSCSKDPSVTPEPSQPVFTITFTNNYISPQVPVILFLSYPDGTNYIDTTCSMNGTYTLYPPAGKPVPQTFLVTLVDPEPFWHSFSVQISTFAGIANGSTWAVSGYKTDTVGTATVSLENLSGSTGPILFSCSGYYDLTMHSTGRTMLLNKVPDDLYVKIQTAGGEFYRYDQNLLDGGNYTVDMSGALPAARQPVALPFTAENFTAMLFGYKDADYDSPLSILADWVISDGIPVDTMNMHYPPSLFSGFHTQVMLEKVTGSGEYYMFNNEGAIPSSLPDVNAVISTLQYGNSEVSFTPAGTFNMTAAQWNFIDHGNIIYGWKYWAPDTTRLIRLPEIPPAFSTLFPTISHDSLMFEYAELSHLLSVSSYNELINKMFDPSHPTQMDRYDAAMYRRMYMPLKSR
jgi:hypothetical protein